MRTLFFLFAFLTGVLCLPVWSHHTTATFTVKAPGVSPDYRVSITYMGQKRDRSHHYQIQYFQSAFRLYAATIPREQSKLTSFSPMMYHHSMSKLLRSTPNSVITVDVYIQPDHMVETYSEKGSSGGATPEAPQYFKSETYANVLEHSIWSTRPNSLHYVSLLLQPFIAYFGSSEIHTQPHVLNVDSSSNSDSDSSPVKKVTSITQGPQHKLAAIETSDSWIKLFYTEEQDHVYYQGANGMGVTLSRKKENKCKKKSNKHDPFNPSDKGPPPSGGSGACAMYIQERLNHTLDIDTDKRILTYNYLKLLHSQIPQAE